MLLIARKRLGHTLSVGFILSFIGAKDCLGGDVSLGNSGGVANSAGTAGAGLVDTAGVSGGVSAGSAGEWVQANAGAGPGAVGGANSAGAADGGGTLQPLVVSDAGHVASSVALGVSGSLYVASDGMGADGRAETGACESAGHPASSCAEVSTPASSAPGKFDWSKGGLLCTSGVAERVLNRVDMPGAPDWGGMWGSALGFDWLERDGVRQTFDASQRGVVGIAFDIDKIPLAGLRVEFVNALAPNEPAVWQPVFKLQRWVSPLHPGHNELLFEDVKPLPFYEDQEPFDPTQLLAVQFHVPTTETEATEFNYCLSDLSLILGTPTPRNDGCTAPLRGSTGFAYDPVNACVATASTVLACAALDDPALLIPSSTAMGKLPCVSRLSDDQLFFALRAGFNVANVRTLPTSSWSRLSAADFAECTDEEAALLTAAPPCMMIVPL